MLLDLSVSNYKSFQTDAALSLEASLQRDLAYSLLKEKINRKSYRAVSVAVIYGPNAAGKTNIITAADTLRRIVLRGNIENDRTDAGPILANRACADLNLIPNIHSAEEKPVELGVRFITSGMLFEYELSMQLGAFMDYTFRRYIRSESLSVNGHPIFVRSAGNRIEWDSEATGLPAAVRKCLKLAVKAQHEIEAAIADGLRDTDLVLGGPLRTAVGRTLPDIVLQWFAGQLQVCRHVHDLAEAPKPATESGHGWLERKARNEIAAQLGVASEAIVYHQSDEQALPQLTALIDSHGERFAVPADVFESHGTNRLLRVFPAVLHALETGGALLMDELDASLHPAVVGAIIGLFHSDTVNVNGAQLIFNTHNPIYLNRTLCRRDELKFVGADSMADGANGIWSLSEFGAEDSGGARDRANYFNKYMKGTYGAINDVDFSRTFESPEA